MNGRQLAALLASAALQGVLEVIDAKKVSPSQLRLSILIQTFGRSCMTWRCEWPAAILPRYLAWLQVAIRMHSHCSPPFDSSYNQLQSACCAAGPGPAAAAARGR